MIQSALIVIFLALFLRVLHMVFSDIPPGHLASIFVCGAMAAWITWWLAGLWRRR